MEIAGVRQSQRSAEFQSRFVGRTEDPAVAATRRLDWESLVCGAGSHRSRGLGLPGARSEPDHSSPDLAGQQIGPFKMNGCGELGEFLGATKSLSAQIRFVNCSLVHAR